MRLNYTATRERTNRSGVDPRTGTLRVDNFYETPSPDSTEPRSRTRKLYSGDTQEAEYVTIESNENNTSF